MRSRSRTKRTWPIQGIPSRAVPWLAALIVALSWTDLGAADQPGGAAAKAAPKDASAGKAGATSKAGVEEVPATLDLALAKAMDNHPDIVAAKAKLMLAETELNRTRMEVARKVVAVWNDRQAQEQTADAVRRHLQSGTGATTLESMIAAKASLAQSQAELRYLTGQVFPAASRSRDVTAASRPQQMPRGPVVEKIRKALSSPSQLEFSDETLENVLDYLKDYHKIEIHRDSKALEAEGITVGKEKITINTKGAPLAAALQLLEDQHPPLKFVVRDYGILVTTAKRAEEEGFLPAVEFAHLSEGGETASPGEHSEPAGARPSLPERSPASPVKSPTRPK